VFDVFNHRLTRVFLVLTTAGYGLGISPLSWLILPVLGLFIWCLGVNYVRYLIDMDRAYKDDLYERQLKAHYAARAREPWDPEQHAVTMANYKAAIGYRENR
jgi:hypothetical protein